MIATQVNPAWLGDDAYIAFLSRGFAARWTRADFEFYVRRPFDGKSSDIGVRTDGRKIAAGVSYCYRQLQLGRSHPIDVCVMSAGATVPAERGRGHYVELLKTGLALSRERGCAAILGFVTRNNASGRGLARLGAYSIPSYYLASTLPGRAGSRAGAQARDLPAAELVRSRPHLQAFAGAHFHYPSAEDWIRQFVARPHPVRAVCLAHDSLALLESVGQTDRLQWLGCPAGKRVACLSRLIAASRAAGRRFFMYTLDPRLARGAARLGLRQRDGLLMLLPVDSTLADWKDIANSPWELQSGDRI